MSISIAICDDEEEIALELERRLLNIQKEIGIPLDIDVFFSGMELCKHLKKNKYGLIFLDIELPKMDGVEVGHFIREKLYDEVTQIAYISSKQKYAMELFESRPINFLIKPLKKEDILKILEKYMTLAGEFAETFHYKKGRKIVQIPLSDIMYFERNTRKVKLYSKDGVDEFYEVLENVYSFVKKHKFLFIHKSYIINCNYIKKMGYESVVMTNDVELPISQARRKDIRDMWMQYITEDE